MDYDVIFSKRRTVSLEITKDCKVLVRAPFGVSRSFIESFVKSNASWIEKHKSLTEMRLERERALDQEKIRELKEKANLILPPLAEKYSSLTGLKFTGIKVTGAKTRFGSCSPKNSLSFSWRLMEYPRDFIEYVVLHEVAHIKYKNHSSDFYGFVAQYMPNYKEIIRKTKEFF